MRAFSPIGRSSYLVFHTEAGWVVRRDSRHIAVVEAGKRRMSLDSAHTG
jgi:hypothetical protein